MKRNIKSMVIALTLLSISAIAAAKNSKAQSLRPNIVLVTVNNFGWQDTSVPFWKNTTVRNRTIETPALEKLAKSGTLFRRAYASSLTTPSRISLMTGMSPAAHRVTGPIGDFESLVDNEQYFKLIFPKWNINGLQPNDKIPYSLHATTLPEILSKNGYTVIISGKTGFAAPGTDGFDARNFGYGVTLTDDQNRTAIDPKVVTSRACEALNQVSSNDNRPFFLHVAYHKNYYSTQFDNRFYKKYRNKGLCQKEAINASMIQAFDQGLADIMTCLEELNIDDNTIIIFMSLNGAPSINTECEAPDNSHNYPLNAGKGSAYEGGVRVPLIIRLPQSDNRAESCSTAVNVKDLMPTILELAQIKRYKTIQKIEGLSIVPLLSENRVKSQLGKRYIHWHFPNRWGGSTTTPTASIGYGPTSSIVWGDWKLVYYYETEQTELFNLNDDIFEIVNQAGSKSVAHIKKRLANELTRHLKRTNAQLPEKIGGGWCDYPNGDQFFEEIDKML